MNVAASAIYACIVAAVFVAAQSDAHVLTDQQVAAAIELGRAGQVAIVQVGTVLGVSKGDFNVFIEGPIARIASAASRAFREYRPFDPSKLTPEMKESIYRVIFKRDFESHRSTPLGDVRHVVLQPRRAKGMDGVIQPVRESIGNQEALFDRFPDGEFDVVIATEHEVQKYSVSVKQRAKIQ